MDRKIRKGEVYIQKKRDKSYVLIVEGFDGSRVIVRASNSRDTEQDFIGYTSPLPMDHFLELYELATPEQLEPLIRDLRERRGVIEKKIIYLEGFAQSQPKCTEPEFQTSLDRDALARLGQPMYDWRFKPTALE